ncbi:MULTISPECIES: guanitoxin biosynthesis MBL fold metallo-hydrolase GntH [unclassified Rhodococcus (in: high G+C Gram-positive bacteria)]|uniref:guanitoxin biosynthesis MBL fold metallo-hydrolase GntH n=1 Tax=unclassified Rhodococcus (in: high G+C Gram-positive bacteria) TaxID=192944 RepID=UPI00092AD80A|nr:guanitoxin biosynthesis MBL fold metallo-hydrolase GntH [Rhodococcus sp. M8]OLL18752.1 MBL fold metallo-hydrolase [Rhodococcus sp. M8]QPG47438.1 MBL fold metallo-hydrolase [Rhodococcus sp. M8]
MVPDFTELTELAFEGGSPLTTTPVLGTPSSVPHPDSTAGTEPVRDGEIRVTVLGSGDPFVKPSQASASLLIEVGNPERDLFFFDLGSGALANYNGLRLPVTATTKVFLSHLHADHVGDMPTLVWSLAKAGRRDPVEVWGPAGETPELGTRSYIRHLEAAHAWDMQSLCGHPGQSGAHTVTTEVPWDRTATVYERNGVQVSSFPVIHMQNGSVGYRLDYNGRSVVFSGDTRPCRTLVDACDGADLLVHETFPSASVFARKAGVPPDFAEKVVNGSHTSPHMAGEVFARAGARMSTMWHLAVDHETVGPVYAEMRTRYDGPVTIAQDLTVFDISADAIVTRQAQLDPTAWPVLGPTKISGPPESALPQPPAWWAEALISE